MMPQVLLERPKRPSSALVDLSAKNLTFSIDGALAATAFAVCTSSPAIAVRAIDPVRLNPGSVSVQIIAREEDTKFSVTDALAEIRVLTGLTWEQLAKVLNVSRRTVHAWIAGTSEVRGENAARVEEILTKVRSWRDQPVFKVRNQLLAAFGVSTGGEHTSTEEAPILTADNRPFKHPVVKKAASSLRIRRG